VLKNLAFFVEHHQTDCTTQYHQRFVLGRIEMPVGLHVRIRLYRIQQAIRRSRFLRMKIEIFAPSRTCGSLRGNGIDQP
jgi:hypothetical protein